ncbi:MAG TPA: SusC/RagA family TonB-linked outer membrane protein [Flavisolibacter sp.]|nr:SusC/RagA family TonB-linked outer membrane protein [Flavisolibacter sp.]
MELKPIRFEFCEARKKVSKPFFAMRTLLFISLCCYLPVSAQNLVVKITLSLQNAPLEEVFREIKKQSGYNFVYTREQIRKAKPTTLTVKEAGLEETLHQCFLNQPLTYVIENGYIAVKDKPQPAVTQTTVTLTGIVRDDSGKPLSNATIQVKGTEKLTITDHKGHFYFTSINENAILLISSIGYHTQEVAVERRDYVDATLRLAVSALDETVIVAYGKTTQRLNTGNVGRVSAREIANQPVSNPIAAIQGRIPGVLITQGSGNAGASFNIQIRGQSSVGGYANAPYPVGNDPLYIIDGIPYSPGNKLNQLVNAATTPGDPRSGGLSPLNLIDPADIESIEILKDADATAIYGSRGANGVVLITTKRGKAGKSKVDFNFYSGISKPTRMVKYLSTHQYIAMRKEAFANDRTVPNLTNAPDLLLFDSTSHTDYNQLFYGDPGRSTDVQLAFSGGSPQTQFILSGGYHYEKSMLPGNFDSKRPNVNINLNHQSADGRFKLGFSSNYSFNDNNLANRDLTQFLSFLPPNNPPLVDANGDLLWNYAGVSYINPLAYTYQRYRSTADNLLSNLSLSYEAAKHLLIKTSFGFTNTFVEESSIVPKMAQDPQNNPTGFADFSNRRSQSWLIEPLAEYKRSAGKGKLEILIGGTFQHISSKGNSTKGLNYASDLLLNSISNAGSVTTSNTFSQYRYMGAFGRINYNWKEKLILNLTGRRDGSSRFGPGKQFSNFGAVGFAWIFSREQWVRNHLKLLSFGKWRTSYGTSGNDQIGDYIYMDTWSPTTTNYQGSPGLRPTGLFNPDFAWEINRKLEFALDLGFLKDRVLVSAAYFRNRSGNQLISYRLPSQTGFSSLRARNFPALVQNTGLELAVNSQVLKRKHLSLNLHANATIPRNKLIQFPGLATSSYANIYVVGQSLSVVRGYRFLGVDPQTGIYQFEDSNHDNAFTNADYQVLDNLVPKIYGGFGSTLSFRGVTFDLFFEYRKQTGRSMAFFQSDAFPGMPFNQPTEVLKRWQKPGDQADLQRFTATPGSPAYIAALQLLSSSGSLTDASYVRLKNVALSYSIPSNLLSRWNIQGATLFLNAQNLFVISDYTGDPETQNYKVLPPLKTLVAGLRFTF